MEKSCLITTISKPAQRALIHAEILTDQQLASFTEKDLLKLHGIGPSAIPKITEHLKEKGLSLKK
jgi:DNA-directed RNA polymerase alpha subunit